MQNLFKNTKIQPEEKKGKNRKFRQRKIGKKRKKKGKIVVLFKK